MKESILALLVMASVFAGLCFIAKLHISICLACAALVGCLVSGNGLGLRYLVEGSFSYLDTILVIATAMIFMKVIEAVGTLEAISTMILRRFYRRPALLLVCLTILMMLPGMVTGSSTAAVLSVGSIVAPVMLMLGIDAVTTASLIAYGAILGMIAPPVNLPALMICSGVDVPFVSFELPLLLLVLPLAILVTLIMGLKKAKKLTKEQMEAHLGEKAGKKYSWRLFIPVIVLILLILLTRVFKLIPDMAMPLTFLISAASGCLSGKKLPLLDTLQDAVHSCLPVMGILMAVGMFIEVMTLTGVRGLIVVGGLSLPQTVMIIVAAVTMPLFGAISCFGSASVLGVPFSLALLSQTDITIAICGLSLMAAMGDFIPPAALAGRISAKTAGAEPYGKVVTRSLLPIGISLIYAVLYVLFSKQIAGVLL